jgi:fumarate hydratase subunit alpha
LCVKANCVLRPDVASALKKAAIAETNPRARRILNQLLENADAAKCDRVAICQDTGLPIVFVEIGRGMDVFGLNLERAINQGIADGYRKGFLRNSVILDPLDRRAGSTNAPGVIHFSFKSQPRLKITVMPKGFGCENKTQLKMFLPTSTPSSIEAFVVQSVRDAGPDACPPYVVGVGIGGSSDVACQLSKQALLRPVGTFGKQGRVAKMEKNVLKKCNATGIGPMGLGGKTTVLGVHILTNPTHIAGLPVCVNISCHALRSATVIL